jgi:hypothetical protein
MRRLFQITGLALAAVTLGASNVAAQTAAAPIRGGGLAPGQDAPPPPEDGVVAPATYIRRDRWDCADFSRKPDATWSANRSVAFPAPDGLLKVDRGSIYRIGQSYGGYDLAAMLEHDCPKG